MALVVVSACGDGGASSSDAGVGEGGLIVERPAAPAAPEIPWYDVETGEESLAVVPPAIAPCPPGWREVDGACDPWPESGPMRDCALGTAHFPGEAGCVTVGTPCPPGDFALGLPDDGSVLFVSPGAAGGGDGTRATPFRTIADALAAASAGTTIALAKGVYDEPVVLPEGVTLAGACAAETLLSPSSGSAYAVIYTEAADTAVADLSIVDAAFPGIIATGVAAGVDVSGVVIGGAHAIGLLADTGATMTLERVVIRETRANSAGNFGRAVLAQAGARVSLAHAIIEGHVDASVAAIGEGTAIEVRDATIRDTRGDDAGIGRGVWAPMGGAVTLERVEIATSYEVGLFAEDTGTVTLTMGVVRDTIGYPSDFVAGAGVMVESRGSVHVSKAAFHGNHTYGVYVGGLGQAVLEDVVIRDTLPDPGGGDYGFGLLVRDTGTATLTRAVLSGNRTAAIRLFADPATLTATDLVIRDTLPSAADGTYGRAIELIDGAVLTLSRARLERNRADAIFVVGSRLDAEDLVVADTTTQPGEGDGRGISCGEGATCDVRRALLARNGGVGVILSGARATIEDLVVVDTRYEGGDTGFVSGSALDVREASVATARRVLFQRNRSVGVSVLAAGTMLTLEDAVVEETLPSEPSMNVGIGVVVTGRAGLTGARVRLSDNTVAGLFAAGPATTASLTDLHVADTLPTARGSRGWGIAVADRATSEIDRLLLERNRAFSFIARGEASVRLSHVTVLEPLVGDCGEGCAVGVGATEGASAEMSFFHVESSPFCGVWVGPEGQLDLVDGEIAQSEIGACVHSMEYDVQRLTERVRYRDNRVNIEAVDLVTPEPEVSLGGL